MPAGLAAPNITVATHRASPPSCSRCIERPRLSQIKLGVAVDSFEPDPDWAQAIPPGQAVAPPIGEGR
jgi:hypothetical protein